MVVGQNYSDIISAQVSCAAVSIASEVGAGLRLQCTSVEYDYIKLNPQLGLSHQVISPLAYCTRVENIKCRRTGETVDT